MDVGIHCNMDMPKMNEDVARVTVMNGDEAQSLYFLVRPLHLVFTTTAGLAIAVIFYIVVRHKTRGTHPVGQLWKLVSMIDIALCVSALAAVFYQHVANEKECVKCVHISLTTILIHSFTAAWIMFAVAGLRTVIVYEISNNLPDEARAKSSRGKVILFCFLTVTCLIIVSMNFAMGRWRLLYAQLEVCITDKTSTNMAIPFAWVSYIIALLVFQTRHGPDQSDHTFYLEFSTHFIPLISAFIWLDGCAVNAGLYNVSSIVLVACVMFSIFSSIITFPVPVFTLASRECPASGGYKHVITVI